MLGTGLSCGAAPKGSSNSDGVLFMTGTFTYLLTSDTAPDWSLFLSAAVTLPFS
jgi:hypothetical protein